MKRLLAIAFALFAVSTAQAQQKTTSAIKTDITSLLPSTGAGLITANQLRQVTNEIADSYANKFGDTFTGDVATSSHFKITGASPLWFGGGWATTAIAASKMAVDNVVENNATDSIVNSAYNWPETTYSYVGVSRDFNSAFNGFGTFGSPANAFMAYAVNNGAGNDIVASMSMCRVMNATGRQACFGGNDVVQAKYFAGSGQTPLLIGREIDVQTENAAIVPDTNAGGLFINFFTSQFSGARGILINTLAGASLGTGLQIAGNITGNQIAGLGFVIDPSNNFKTTGTYKTSGYSAIGNNQGSYLAWNKSGGAGEMDFINHQGGGTAGGWYWQNTTDGSSFTQAASLSKTGDMVLGGFARLGKVAVSSLTACNSGAEGTLYAVTDATSATFNAAIVGGGTNHVMAYCNGTGWTVH